MPLDDTHHTPGYLCGRIIAAYELIAARAGKELSVNDLTLSATSPAYTVPRLRAGVVCKALAHLSRQNPQGAARIEGYISDLAARLDHLPEQLDMRQRNEYVLGEAHQKAAGLPL